MVTSILELIEVTESSNRDEILHHYTPEEVFKCVSGLPYKSTCGIIFDPHIQSLDLGENVDDLGSMDKCVMCQTILASQ